MAHANCAIYGVINQENIAANNVYYGLHALQHRGQESAGIVSFQGGKEYSYDSKAMKIHKGFGLVLDVFSDADILKNMNGCLAVGHTRYSTSGGIKNIANIQPFTVRYKRGQMALAHNGNITNFNKLKNRLIERGTLFATTSDSELLLHMIALSPKDTEIGQIMDALSDIEGAFSMILMTHTHMYAIRDPKGFRPLVLGRGRNEYNNSYFLASETCAFDLTNVEYIREIEPGEILVMSLDTCKTGEFNSYHWKKREKELARCVFEYVYFSRPDSYVFGAMVDAVRQELGVQLAIEAPAPNVNQDELSVAIVAVPDSSNTAALGFQRQCMKMGLNTSFEIGIIRNHYVGRTFITPNQNKREMKVRCKFNTVGRILKDRIVVLVDDSIVRGTTSKQLVQMVKNAGAKEVHFRVCSPPVQSPCFYGMDFPTSNELLANQVGSESSIEKMCNWLGAESLAFLSVDGMMKTVLRCNNDVNQDQASGNGGYCNACFSNNYPVEIEEAIDVTW